MAATCPTSGQRLGHYRLLEQIGAGGMGVVFRARDERLERDVAIKILPPGLLGDETAPRRFRKEALALSRLNHPNIATVHDFDSQEGTAYLVTEFIPGVTLSEKVTSGGLPEREVIELALQLLDGLAAAHAQGVVHRDLKPANLRLTPEGRLKILDFGLAMRLDRGGEATATCSEYETRPAGTAQYMSPEQLRGELVDARSDIWACGVVLYELATGRRPFEGRTLGVIIDQVMHDEIVPPQTRQPATSPGLNAIILRCLEREPERRYQAAEELQNEMRDLTLPSPVPRAAPRARAPTEAVRTPALRKRARPRRIRSLAVLPLSNLSRDPEQEYFADGMTEALICNLAKIRAVKVTSRTSVMRYKGTEAPLPQIAETLGVDGVIEGSVLRAGTRVRITAQLIHAATDTHLWAESYDRDLEDVLLVQSELAQAIAREIQAALTPEETKRLKRARRVDPEAYEAFLKGRFHWYKLSREHLDKAMEYFQFALEKDPTSALAYSGIAWIWLSRGDIGVVSPREAVPKGRAAALKAIELDETLAEAHITLAMLNAVEWNWEEAEREYRRAIEMMPNSADAHFFLSDILVSRGRATEWQAEIERALQLDPLSTFMQCFLGWHLLYLRRYDDAIAALEKTLRDEPNFTAAHLRLWTAYRQKGMNVEAAAEAEAFFAVLGDAEVAQALRIRYPEDGYATAMRAAAELLVERSRTRFVQPTQVARLYAHAGDTQRALDWLERAYEERQPAMVHLAVDPDWEGLHGEPRFQELRRRVSL